MPIQPWIGQIGKPSATNYPGFFSSLTVNGISQTPGNVVALNSATAAPTPAQSGTIFLLNRAGGITATLPPPLVGLNFVFYVVASVTATAYKIITDAATTFLQGVCLTGLATEGDTALFQGNGSSHVSFNMNGSTTGGLIGSQVTFKCIESSTSPSGLWQVEGVNFGSGSLATSFATS